MHCSFPWVCFLWDQSKPLLNHLLWGHHVLKANILAILSYSYVATSPAAFPQDIE